MIHLAVAAVTPNQLVSLLGGLVAGKREYSVDRTVREEHPLDRRVWYVEDGEASSLSGHLFLGLGVDPGWLAEREEWNPFPLWQCLRQVPRMEGDDRDAANIMNTVWTAEQLAGSTWGQCLGAARFEHLAVINRQRIGKDF